jgi:oxygen-dependent protoporphyrinogen oxidase
VHATRVDVDLAGSGFLVPPVDGRLIKAATFASRKWAWLDGDVLVLRCSIGRHREEADLQRDDSDLVDGAVMDLREATGLHVPLLDAVVTRWGGALPQYAVGHLDRVARIDAVVAAVPGLEVCGAAYGGVGIPAVIASGTQAATRVAATLTTAGTMDV